MVPLRRAFVILAVAGISLFATPEVPDPETREWPAYADAYQLHETLRALAEPPLEPGLGVEAYRFTWLRSFHAPLAVRVAERHRSAVLHVAQLRRTGAQTFEVAGSGERLLTREQWSDLRAAVQQSGFWHMPRSDDRFGFDGAVWILEGVQGFRYHVVYRWTPDENEPFRKACLELLGHSGLQIDPEDVY